MKGYPDVKDKDHNKKAASFELEYDGVFNLKEFYKMVYEWCKINGFEAIDKGEPEVLYMELVNGSGMKFHHIWWRFHRVESKYHKFFLKIDFQTLAVSSVEIVHNGKKVKTHKGNPIIRVEGWLMLDYNKEWRNHWFLKMIDHWFINRWYKDKISQYKKKLWFLVYDLQDTMKQYLELNTSTDRLKPWIPNKGLPP